MLPLWFLPPFASIVLRAIYCLFRSIAFYHLPDSPGCESPVVMDGGNEIAAVGGVTLVFHGCGDRIGNRHGSAADALHTAKRAAGQEN